MSVEALSWLAKRAPGVKPSWVGTLFALCNDANEQGRGSYPTQAVMAEVARKSERAIRDDLAAMEAAGLIRRGDQRMVAHYEPDRRPVVWDLALERHRELPPRPEPGQRGRPGQKRGEVHRRPEASFPPPGGSTPPPGSTLPPVSDLGEQGNGGKSEVKRGEASFRHPLGKETRRTPLGEGGTPAPPGSTTPELTAEEHALAMELCGLRPDWSPVSVRKVLVAAEIRERRDRALVRLALLIAADDRGTRTPYRLLHDACPAWGRAAAELYPAEAAAEPEVEVLIGRRPPCGDPGCDSVTRMLVNPDDGYPLPGRPRCPRCHPQSPALPPP